MTKVSPNFLTCPIDPIPDLPPKGPEGKDVVVPDTRKNPFEPKTSEPVSPRPKRHFRLRTWIIAILAAIVVVAVVPAAVSFVRAAIAAQRVSSSVKSAQANLKNMNVDAAIQDLTNARASLDDVRGALRGVGFWRDLPGIGTQVRALEDAASAGSGTLDSAGDILNVASVLVDALRGGAAATTGITTGIAPTRSFNDLSPQEKRDLLAKFNDQLPTLRLARDKMDLALELWNRVPQAKLAGPIRDALKPLADAIPVLKKSLDEAVPIIEVLVPMAGYPDAQNYLLALQNADEMRPAGGFIGTVGTMRWDAGDLSNFLFMDVYAVDNPVSGVWKQTPPAPLRQYLNATNWFMRDANWSPDFSVSAETVLDFFIRESELQLHGPLPNRPQSFIAFEPGFFKSILKLTGPITVGTETFTSDNFFDKLEYDVEMAFHQQGIPVEHRKDIVSQLGDEIRNKLFAMPAARWPEILDLVTTSLEQKQIMAYSREPGLQALFDARGWSGRAKPTQGDFLWVADANLAAYKTDGAMQKAVSYTLDATDPAGPKATVTLTYKNTAPGFGDYRYTRYRSYTRVYVPEGSQLISSSGAMKNDLNVTGGRFIPGTVDVMKDLGKTVFGAFWSVEPAHTGTLSFTYRLPKDVSDRIANGTYRLDWPKQPGVDGSRLTLDLLFGKNIQSASPSEDQSHWGDARYQVQTDSLVDRVFTISF